MYGRCATGAVPMAEPGDVAEAVLLPTQLQARPCSMRPEREEIHTQGDDISLKMNQSRNKCQVRECRSCLQRHGTATATATATHTHTYTHILSSTHIYKLHDPSTSN